MKRSVKNPYGMVITPRISESEMLRKID